MHAGTSHTLYVRAPKGALHCDLDPAATEAAPPVRVRVSTCAIVGHEGNAQWAVDVAPGGLLRLATYDPSFSTPGQIWHLVDTGIPDLYCIVNRNPVTGEETQIVHAGYNYPLQTRPWVTPQRDADGVFSITPCEKEQPSGIGTWISLANHAGAQTWDVLGGHPFVGCPVFTWRSAGQWWFLVDAQR